MFPQRRSLGNCFFLFTANNTLPNHDVWKAFFRNHKRGEDYEAFLHCQDEAACKDKYADFADVINTVKQKYCEDLVSPMLALLEPAVSSRYLSRGPGIGPFHNDLFIFISETTVPVKSFQGVQSLYLSLRGKSSMCIAPWGTSKHGYVDGGVAVKHSQWMVLSRGHAALSVNREGQPPKSRFWEKGEGCLDEFWFYYRIFGPLHVGTVLSEENFRDTSAQQFWTALSKVDGLDRRCYTYFDMSQTINDKLAIGQGVPHAPVFMGMDKAPYDADTERHQTAGKFGPAHFEYLTLKHLREWKQGPLAFIRKVDGMTQIEGGIPLHEALLSTVLDS